MLASATAPLDDEVWESGVCGSAHQRPGMGFGDETRRVWRLAAQRFDSLSSTGLRPMLSSIEGRVSSRDSAL